MPVMVMISAWIPDAGIRIGCGSVNTETSPAKRRPNKNGRTVISGTVVTSVPVVATGVIVPGGIGGCTDWVCEREPGGGNTENEKFADGIHGLMVVCGENRSRLGFWFQGFQAYRRK